MRFHSRVSRILLAASLLAAAPVPPGWAQHAERSSGGILHAPAFNLDNFGQAGPGYYRGAQPEGSDYAELAAIGVRTVIDLQAEGDNADEAALVEAAGMRFHRIPMTGRVPPTTEQVRQFLAIVTDPALAPVYVHCKVGRHRTGVMTAVIRMERDGWSAEEAFAEMKRYQFGWDFLHPEFKRFVFDYRPGVLATLSVAGVAGP